MGNSTNTGDAIKQTTKPQHDKTLMQLDIMVIARARPGLVWIEVGMWERFWHQGMKLMEKA